MIHDMPSHVEFLFDDTWIDRDATLFAFGVGDEGVPADTPSLFTTALQARQSERAI